MILVTGGTGFIGSMLVAQLVDCNYDVACVCRNNSNFQRVENIYDKIYWVNDTEESLTECFEKYDIEGVIHCATTYGRKGNELFGVIKANVNFPLLLLELASRYNSKYFINTDSFFVRELNDSWSKNTKVYMDTYTKSKYIFRELIRDNMHNLDIAFINLELQHIYGEKDAKGKFVTYLIEQLKNNVPLIELTEGNQSRDWTYVTDVVDAYITIINNVDIFSCGRFYEYEVGTGVATTLKEFCLKVKEISGASTELLFGKKEMNKFEIMHSVANNEALRQLGWEPRVNIDEGVRRLFEL